VFLYNCNNYKWGRPKVTINIYLSTLPYLHNHAKVLESQNQGRSGLKYLNDETEMVILEHKGNASERKLVIYTEPFSGYSYS
jgi:hypothetical protein